jgi:hypothetical protein
LTVAKTTATSKETQLIATIAIARMLYHSRCEEPEKLVRKATILHGKFFHLAHLKSVGR